MTTAASTSVGALLVLLLAIDAFATVLDASSGAGPYTSIQNRLLWRAARALAPLVPWRRRVLSLAAPAMALATPVAWVCLLTVGFAFLYLPWVETFMVDPPAAVPSWVLALYYSGYLTATLGLGDVIPTGTGWRLAAVAQAGMGFGLFSASFTYILSIYNHYGDGAGLALHLHNTLWRSDLVGWGEGESEQRVVVRNLAIEFAGRLARVNVAHEQYPILHYFHGRAEVSLIVQVGRLIELARAAPEEERSGIARALVRTIENYLDQMPFETGSGDLAERHGRLLEAHAL